MRQEPWFCLFQGDAGPMAVSAESVAEVIRTDSLVRLAWSPPQVVGLCPYHREVVPVVRFAPLPPDLGGDRSSEANPASGAKPDGDDHSRCILLILRTEHGAWGIQSDFVWTVMSREGPEYHQGLRGWVDPHAGRHPPARRDPLRRPGCRGDLARLAIGHQPLVRTHRRSLNGLA